MMGILVYTASNLQVITRSINAIVSECKSMDTIGEELQETIVTHVDILVETNS